MPSLRRFYLNRMEDVSGQSGTGRIANGIQFPDGVCVIRWVGKTPTTTIYNNIKHLEGLHGHDGKTKVVWIDKATKRNILDSGGYIRY